MGTLHDIKIRFPHFNIFYILNSKFWDGRIKIFHNNQDINNENKYINQSPQVIDIFQVAQYSD